MNRFAAAALVNLSAQGKPSYKAALLTVLQQQGKGSQGGDNDDWLQAALASASNDDDLRPDKAIDYTEMRSKDYTEGPGEMDMLIGFFLMNGVCVVFFLTFGLCVICSCMRRRPKFQNPEEPPPIQKTPLKTAGSFTSAMDKLRAKSLRRTASPNPAAPKSAAPPITSPSLKPTFKAIVARAMHQHQMAKSLNVNNNNLLRHSVGVTRSTSSASAKSAEQIKMVERAKETANGIARVQQVDESLESSSSLTALDRLRGKPQSAVVRRKAAEEEEDTRSTATSNDEPPSVVRQNLLGPLSFDDLYYT